MLKVWGGSPPIVARDWQNSCLPGKSGNVGPVLAGSSKLIPHEYTIGDEMKGVAPGITLTITLMDGGIVADEMKSGIDGVRTKEASVP